MKWGRDSSHTDDLDLFLGAGGSHKSILRRGAMI